MADEKTTAVTQEEVNQVQSLYKNLEIDPSDGANRDYSGLNAAAHAIPDETRRNVAMKDLSDKRVLLKNVQKKKAIDDILTNQAVANEAANRAQKDAAAQPTTSQEEVIGDPKEVAIQQAKEPNRSLLSPAQDGKIVRYLNGLYALIMLIFLSRSLYPTAAVGQKMKDFARDMVNKVSQRLRGRDFTDDEMDEESKMVITNAFQERSPSGDKDKRADSESNLTLEPNTDELVSQQESIKKAVTRHQNSLMNTIDKDSSKDSEKALQETYNQIDENNPKVSDKQCALQKEAENQLQKNIGLLNEINKSENEQKTEASNSTSPSQIDKKELRITKTEVVIAEKVIPFIKDKGLDALPAFLKENDGYYVPNTEQEIEQLVENIYDELAKDKTNTITKNELTQIFENANKDLQKKVTPVSKHAPVKNDDDRLLKNVSLDKMEHGESISAASSSSTKPTQQRP